MSSTDRSFTGSIPEIYQRYLVPLIFEGYARDLADRVAASRARDVLETAVGTGVVTRAIAGRLPADGHLFATDLNQAMLERAQVQQAGDRRIEWKQADALALPFANAGFDAVACQFGVMFFPDKVRGFGEARRVLKPGGRFFFNVWNRISANEFADITNRTLEEIFPADPPRFLERTPHGYHDADRIGADLRAAGFADVTIDTVELRSKAASPRDPAIGFCQGSPLRAEIEARDSTGLDDVTATVARAIEKRFGAGPVEGRISALVVTAVNN